ncbi:MAG TPA: 16S rRNA (guanine(966)-N(2))-methyltransferase RsmD [Candidatus Saccharimonadales bacterium]|nr:16S rRNA (guanine(966)-N(2))-methyltransferase RsmD [Candidatus Saccharimonadales bacterium]
MRVIAGKYRSRQLKSLKGMALRPTSDRLRETLFNILSERIPGSRFVDIFAGTGAVGIEALSRGAAEAIFIERHAPAAALIRKNLEALEINMGTRVLSSDALHGLELLEKEIEQGPTLPTIVFLDPPYGNIEDYDRVLSFLGFAVLLDEKSLVIAEHRKNFDLPEAIGDLQRVRVLKQGDACLSFYRVSRSGQSASLGPQSTSRG